jgi:hypothetical protein
MIQKKMRIDLASQANSALLQASQPTQKRTNPMTTINSILAEIARRHLSIETLETRNADSLDFYDTSVWCVRDALEAAFKAGAVLGASMPKPTESEIVNT